MTREEPPGAARVERWKDGRAWAVYDERGELVCVALYRRGALEVARRLSPQARPAPMVRKARTPGDIWRRPAGRA